ncbi:TRIM2_3 [Mytilus coruscus]|uniref:TRIM2_3 n=1 Tax=Mytilus coruscus TaxID=42192 RepID=A0A6J8B9M9_MYTCO|nr:TRIM2_3 [Mytilus coruscus]
MLEKDVTEELKYVRDISEDEGFSQLGLKCIIDGKITDILTEMAVFGSISIEKSQSPIVIGVGHEKQAQIFTAVPSRSRSIDDITATLIGSVMVPAGQSSIWISGLSVFPDGRMIFANCFYNKRLVIVQRNGTLDTEIPISPLIPHDSTCIDDKTVAVPTLYNNTIVILDTENKQVTNTIKTGRCRGIIYRQEQLLYCEIEKGIVGIQLSNNKVITIVKDDTVENHWSYITTSGENIYYTGNGSTVKCYSVRGEKRWEYKNNSILMDPTGIAVDQNGVVYVLSNGDKCVVLISEDGKNGRTLFTIKDGITESYGIYLRTNKLIVVTLTGQILQFNKHK